MRNNFYKSFRHFPHFYILPLTHIWSFSVGFPGGSVGKKSTCNQLPNHLGLSPGLGRPPGGGHGNPLQYSCWENPMDRGAWQARVHRVVKSQTRLKRLGLHSCTKPKYSKLNNYENKDMRICGMQLKQCLQKKL